MSILSDKTIRLLCEPLQFAASGVPGLLSPQDAHELLVRVFPDSHQPSRRLLKAGELHIPMSGLPKLEELLQMEDGQRMEFNIAYSRQNPLHLTARRQSPMISPFISQSLRRIQYEGKQEFPILSSGTSSFGYDVTLKEEFKIFSNANGGVIDPKRFDPTNLIDGRLNVDEATGEKWVILPPNSYLLGETHEVFSIPRDVSVVAVGKSTYARAGAIVNVTPIEAGFKGTVVIEISNATTLPMRIYANEGVAQFLFFQGDQPCETSYGDRNEGRGGKYQHQRGIRLSQV